MLHTDRGCVSADGSRVRSEVAAGDRVATLAGDAERSWYAQSPCCSQNDGLMVAIGSQTETSPCCSRNDGPMVAMETSALGQGDSDSLRGTPLVHSRRVRERPRLAERADGSTVSTKSGDQVRHEDAVGH